MNMSETRMMYESFPAPLYGDEEDFGLASYEEDREHYCSSDEDLPRKEKSCAQWMPVSV